MCFGRLFHVSWNAVPVELEHCSNLAGTGVQLNCNKARAEKAHNKSLSGEEWKVAFRGRKGELVVVIGYGTNRLDSAKLASDFTWIWDYMLNGTSFQTTSNSRTKQAEHFDRPFNTSQAHIYRFANIIFLACERYANALKQKHPPNALTVRWGMHVLAFQP